MTYDQIDQMTCDEWLSYRADKLQAFYESGKDLIPDPKCKQCDVVNDYVCFDCEVGQIGE
jgi:hypothetical protein